MIRRKFIPHFVVASCLVMQSCSNDKETEVIYRDSDSLKAKMFDLPVKNETVMGISYETAESLTLENQQEIGWQEFLDKMKATVEQAESFSAPNGTIVFTDSRYRESRKISEKRREQAKEELVLFNSMGGQDDSDNAFFEITCEDYDQTASALIDQKRVDLDGESQTITLELTNYKKGGRRDSYKGLAGCENYSKSSMDSIQDYVGFAHNFFGTRADELTIGEITEENDEKDTTLSTKKVYLGTLAGQASFLIERIVEQQDQEGRTIQTLAKIIVQPSVQYLGAINSLLSGDIGSVSLDYLYGIKALYAKVAYQSTDEDDLFQDVQNESLFLVDDPQLLPNPITSQGIKQRFIREYQADDRYAEQYTQAEFLSNRIGTRLSFYEKWFPELIPRVNQSTTPEQKQSSEKSNQDVVVVSPAQTETSPTERPKLTEEDYRNALKRMRLDRQETKILKSPDFVNSLAKRTQPEQDLEKILSLAQQSIAKIEDRGFSTSVRGVYLSSFEGLPYIAFGTGKYENLRGRIVIGVGATENNLTTLMNNNFLTIEQAITVRENSSFDDATSKAVGIFSEGTNVVQIGPTSGANNSKQLGSSKRVRVFGKAANDQLVTGWITKNKGFTSSKAK